MTKRAVVVGVNDYKLHDTFPDLQGCIRDADAMWHLLVDAFGFDPSQTFLYKDTRASTSHILSALNYVLSVSEPGDVACLYYAGHGGLHPTNDPATYYQTIVPHSGRFITDWDLWRAAAQLDPGQVNFTVILDCCHSGGMIDATEPTGQVRTVALAEQFIAQAVATMRRVIPMGIALADLTALSENVHGVQAAPLPTLCYSEAANQHFLPSAKATLLAASRWDEYAGESASHGYLTNALLQTVNASNFTMSHSDLHSALTPLVHQAAEHSQHPVIRGQANRMEEAFLHDWQDSR